TRPARELASPQARATSLGVPYDPQRLEIFNRLFAYLTQSQLPMRKESGLSEEETHLAAFFEAYFSNHIEGTEFEVDQAHAIVFQNKIPQERPEDAHDIMGTFRIVSNQQEMRTVPESFDDFISLMTSRHHAVMEARPHKLPGEFKQEPNRAGDTHFVAPELVRGTLLQGFDMYHAVEPGLARAIFMMFMVAEVHPFVDGNGRIARIMMNAELIHADLCRIIVPIVFRDDYLLALRALSRSNNPESLIKVMDFAQLFTYALQWPSYNAVIRTLTACNAFKESDEARLKLPSSLGKGGRI
ncbi:MAG: cell filamentation protein Fic, partial [Deltaproteobacteria bacterium]|nr:cell filamentation protein Fic [Deltaproteobacteria bacterium]